jgi:hypothetical protein
LWFRYFCTVRGFVSHVTLRGCILFCRILSNLSIQFSSSFRSALSSVIHAFLFSRIEGVSTIRVRNERFRESISCFFINLLVLLSNDISSFCHLVAWIQIPQSGPASIYARCCRPILGKFWFQLCTRQELHEPSWRGHACALILPAPVHAGLPRGSVRWLVCLVSECEISFERDVLN